MNKPVKSPRSEKLLVHFLHFQLKKHFYRIYLDDCRGDLPAGPKLYSMNHSSWWDGLLIFYLNKQVLKEDAYALMSKKGLEEFRFFGRIGAFGVDPASPKDLLRSLTVASTLLEEKKSVWIFPQGKEEHIEKRPFTYMNGPAYLHDKADDITIIPVASYYTFRHDQRPELFIRIGSPLKNEDLQSMNRKQKTEYMRVMHEKLVDSVKKDLIEDRTEPYQLMKKGSRTSSEWLQWMKSPLNKRRQT
ncbi:lysophospholipid acyltransferase family protein [Jeotgalibacillus proteolyticus]|uniref:lysophospholipid acyltransferase family protein n=1 Tax=Jeotgalibacillus proteolyticus TaxID=2082395 RepID=UPI003CF2446E